MARGTANGEPVVSQANTESFRDGYERAFGERKPQRGSWVWDSDAGRLVPANQYRPPPRAIDAPIIADRIHEGTAFDDGDRLRDIGSRRKRREFLRETGLVESSDVSRSWLASRKAQREQESDRKADRAFGEAVQKLYEQRRLPK